MTDSSPSQPNSRTSTGAFSQQSTLPGGGTPPPQAPGEAFKRAVGAFRARLSGKELTDFGNATYEQLCATVLRIQKEQETRMELMNLSRIKSCLEAMQQFGKVVEIFLNVSDAVAFVWGPMKFLLLTASTFTESFDTLVDAYERIGEQMPLLCAYESLFHDRPYMTKVLEMIYVDILEFHQRAIKFFSGKLWTRFFRSMWKDFDTKFKGILSNLSRHKDLVERWATLSQYRKHEDDMAFLKSQLDSLVIKEQEKKKLAVKEWLAAGEQSQLDHSNFRQVRTDYGTTAKWILRHPSVENWLKADVPNTSILWMYGIPGAGKTILTSAVIDEYRKNPDAVTSFFYCREGDPASSSATAALKALIDQFLDQYLDILPHCYTKRMSSGEPTLRLFAQASKFLEEFCVTIPKSFIIVDGLDECDKAERKQILDVLMHIMGHCDTHAPGKTRVLFVSQDYPDIRRAFQSTASTRTAPGIFQINETDNEHDINVYTRSWVGKIASKFSPFTNEMEEYLTCLTVANAKGMFLYAKLVLLNLHDLSTRGELLEAIQQNNFPEGLKAAYERIISRIKRTCSASQWAMAKRLLGWMVCAKRQLTWKEIQVALAINVEHQTIEYEDCRPRSHIYETCGSLVLVSGDRVSLVHSTARRYITDVTRDIHEPSIECELATLCLQYLTFPCFEIEDHEALKALAMAGHFAFQDYAIAKWFHHVNAWISNGARFLKECSDAHSHLQAISAAIDDFMGRFDETNWDDNLVEDCKAHCSVFEDHPIYDSLVLLASHIYAFQKKGFEARHKVSIESLATALERNRSILESLPQALNSSELCKYNNFYDKERPFKCTKITCRYFSDGFKNKRARDQHISIHDRPFQCDVSECLGSEGFINSIDLEKHIRAYHPESSDLAEKFSSSMARSAQASHACTTCGQTFTRNFHRKNHELSHRGERPHVCGECGRAFTRLNDLKRHQKLHDRK